MGTKCLCKAFLGASALFVFWGGWNVSTGCQAILWAARESSGSCFSFTTEPVALPCGDIFAPYLGDGCYDNKYHCCGMVPLRCLCVCGCVLCIVEASARMENAIISKSICLAQISIFLLQKSCTNLITISLKNLQKNPSILKIKINLLLWQTIFI